jgi:preprotein translocase subunit SecG
LSLSHLPLSLMHSRPLEHLNSSFFTQKSIKQFTCRISIPVEGCLEITRKTTLTCFLYIVTILVLYLIKNLKEKKHVSNRRAFFIFVYLTFFSE